MTEYDGPPISRVGRVVTITFISDTSAMTFVERFKNVWIEQHKRLKKQERVTKKTLKRTGIWAQRRKNF